jgi:hypothetical protein
MNGASPPNGNPESMPEVVRRLALYLRANPLAGDTKEGIAQWWLGLNPSSTEIVERALRWLESERLLESVQAADGRVHYRRVSLEASIDMQLDSLIAGTTHPLHLTT